MKADMEGVSEHPRIFSKIWLTVHCWSLVPSTLAPYGLIKVTRYVHTSNCHRLPMLNIEIVILIQAPCVLQPACISLASARAKEDQQTKHKRLSKAINEARETYLK